MCSTECGYKACQYDQYANMCSTECGYKKCQYDQRSINPVLRPSTVKRTTVTASTAGQPHGSFSKHNLTNDTFDSLMKEFKDVFEADKITPLTRAPMKIHLNRDDPSYRPIRVSHHRKVPLHFKEEADKTLKWFLDSGVIVPVPPTENVEWVSPGFFVAKPNRKVRLVTDLRAIDQFVICPFHPFPSPRDVVRNIKTDSKWFCKLYALQEYYQIPIDEKSSYLTTFLLPSGIYQFLRASMGLTMDLSLLLKKDVDFMWLQLHQEVFELIRQILTSPLVVKTFDKKLKTELLRDASRLKGLGYALIQRETDGTPHFIKCNSKSLTSAEQGYAVIEIEGLTIQYTIEDCRFYLLGNKFTVSLTDHRTLEGVFQKKLSEVMNHRLLSYRLKLVQYTDM
jgi:hypothetical protein